jgi:HNH endonuclease
MRRASSVEKLTMPAPDLTAEQAREMLSYDPKTGILRWKVERYRKHAGDIAGCLALKKSKNYRWVNISVNYHRYKAHRVIWLMMTGSWPKEEVDHKDNDGWNNKWSNLREATHLQNGKNLKLKKNNTSGVSGVRFIPKRGCFSARIWVNYKEKFLGHFKTLDAATIARNEASKKYHGNFGKMQ